MDYVRLSKRISHALRHAPERYGLVLDECGYVGIDDLIAGLGGGSITRNDIERAIEASNKKRYEVLGDRIRALYGHTTPDRIERIAEEPPAVLYHGTSHAAVESIFAEGLTPQKRQTVHMSVDVETAVLVGSRHDDEPVVLKVDAERAFRDGVR